MDITIFKLNKGANLADSHYTETGHNIELSGRETALGDEYYEKVKFYKCLVCDFSSMGGERIKRY